MDMLVCFRTTRVTGTGALARVSRGRGHWHTLGTQSWAEHGTLCQRRRFDLRKWCLRHPERGMLCQKRHVSSGYAASDTQFTERCAEGIVLARRNSAFDTLNT